MHHSRSFIRGLEPALCGALISLTVTACAGSAPPKASTTPTAREEAPRTSSSPVHKRGGKKLIAEVGEAGGTLELDNGARLVIPPEALSEEIEITLAEGTHTTAFSNHDYERPIGPTIEIAPALTLSAPVTISVPMARVPEGFEDKDLALGLEVLSEEQRAVQMHGVQTRWDYMPASSDSGRAVAQLSGVPGFRLQFVVSKNE